MKTKIPIRSQAVTLLDKAVGKIDSDPIRFAVVFVIVLTGIAQLLRIPLSPIWYGLVILEIGLDFYKSHIKKPTNVK